MFGCCQDVLEFVDCGCNNFLSNMCLVIASYNDMFLNRLQQDVSETFDIQVSSLTLLYCFNYYLFNNISLYILILNFFLLQSYHFSLSLYFFYKVSVIIF